MAKVVFMPWKEHSELIAVRDQFYPSLTYDGPDMRSRACATVGAWKLRGSLPHPVEATALLTDAILHDDAQKNSTFSIRATYSAAFCRFVTGLVDSKLGGQRRTMFQRAVDLGLPASFVELRHEATHRELPSLTVLRSSTQRSLEWLWDFYWAKTDHEAGLPSLGEAGSEALRDVNEDDTEVIKVSARRFFELVTNEAEAAGPPRKKRKVQRQQMSTVATKLISVCKSDQIAPVAVSQIMIQEAYLVPAGRRLGDSLADAITEWDPFLQMMTERYPPFLAALTEEMADMLAFTGPQDVKDDPIREGTGKGNNYAYLVTDEPTKQSVIIDPANPPEVIPELEAQTKAGKINLTTIVNTHHHWDHAGGNDEVLKSFNVPIIGGKNCQSVTKTPAHGEVFKIGERISVTALHTPCHTQDSICYFMQDGDDKVVFTGDTLFIGGCGRFFEGTAPEMHKALNETLASLPDDTKVYPGHEYTKANVRFCLAVSQSEPIKKLEAFAEQNKQTQGKFTIGDEKLHNVFMRVNDPEIQKKTGKTDPVEVMAALREMKNAM